MSIKSFVVDVVLDDECGMWVAACDDLGVSAEAPTFEALTSRTVAIAPELAIENGKMVAGDTLQLTFQHLAIA